MLSERQSTPQLLLERGYCLSWRRYELFRFPDLLAIDRSQATKGLAGLADLLKGRGRNLEEERTRETTLTLRFFAPRASRATPDWRQNHQSKYRAQDVM